MKKKKTFAYFPKLLAAKFTSINQNHDLIECLLCSTEEIPFFVLPLALPYAHNRAQSTCFMKIYEA
jgi:hypothetical protein